MSLDKKTYQFKASSKLEDVMLDLYYKTNAESQADVIADALRVYKWYVEEERSERIVCSISKEQAKNFIINAKVFNGGNYEK